MLRAAQDPSVVCPEQASGKLKLVAELSVALAPDDLDSQRQEAKIAAIDVAGSKHHPLLRVARENTSQPLPREEELRFGIGMIDGLPSASEALEILESIDTFDDHPTCPRWASYERTRDRESRNYRRDGSPFYSYAPS